MVGAVTIRKIALFALSLALAAPAYATQCKNCPATDMIPPEVRLYVSMGCLDGAGMGMTCRMLRNNVVKLAEKCNREDITPEELLWNRFKKSFNSPCEPIPAEFVNPSNKHFGELMRMISPEIVFDPADENPPRSLNRIVHDSKIAAVTAGKLTAVKGDVSKIPYSREAVVELAQKEELTKNECRGALISGGCCGVVNSPLYFDVHPSETNPSVVFTTAHRYGSFMGEYSKSLTEMTSGYVNKGAHIFDSESVKFNFVPSKNDPGSVQLYALTFSRHGLNTEVIKACDDRSPAGDILTNGTHPVLFQANGGHALYPRATYQRGEWGNIRTKDFMERLMEDNDERYATSMERDTELPVLGTRTIASLEAEHAKGSRGCVSSMSPDNIQGIGSLWNDAALGANRDGSLSAKTDGGDVCIEYNDKGGTRSMRYLTGFLERDSTSLARFDCQKH